MCVCVCGGGLISFSKDGVIGSPLRPRIKNGKAQVQEVGGHAAEDTNQSFQLVNKPSWISPHKVLQL